MTASPLPNTLPTLPHLTLPPLPAQPTPPTATQQHSTMLPPPSIPMPRRRSLRAASAGSSKKVPTDPTSEIGTLERVLRDTVARRRPLFKSQMSFAAARSTASSSALAPAPTSQSDLASSPNHRVHKNVRRSQLKDVDERKTYLAEMCREDRRGTRMKLVEQNRKDYKTFDTVLETQGTSKSELLASLKNSFADLQQELSSEPPLEPPPLSLTPSDVRGRERRRSTSVASLNSDHGSSRLRSASRSSLGPSRSGSIRSFASLTVDGEGGSSLQADSDSTAGSGVWDSQSTLGSATSSLASLHLDGDSISPSSPSLPNLPPPNPPSRRVSMSKVDGGRRKTVWPAGGPRAPDVKAERVRKWDKQAKMGRMVKVMKERRLCTLGLQNPRQNLGNLLFLTDTLDPELDQDPDQTDPPISPLFSQPVSVPTRGDLTGPNPPTMPHGGKSIGRIAAAQVKADMAREKSKDISVTPARREKVAPYPSGPARFARRLAAGMAAVTGMRSSSGGDSSGDGSSGSALPAGSPPLGPSRPPSTTSTVTIVTLRTAADVAAHRPLLHRAAKLLHDEMLTRDLDVGDGDDLEQRIVEDGFVVDIVVLATPLPASSVESATAAASEGGTFAVTPHPPHREEPIAVCERTYMKGYLFVQYLCVHHSWQRRGLGAWMMVRMADAGKRREKKGLMLVSVRETVGFYGGMGFEEVVGAGVEWTGGDRLMVRDLRDKKELAKKTEGSGAEEGKDGKPLGLGEELGRGRLWGVPAELSDKKPGAG